MLRLSLVAVLAVSLLGCQLTRVEGEVDDVEVKVSTKDSDGKHSNSDYKFCPPGQAKKGNC
ncbi:hypothetical protein [Vibrio panuliri]|uniref:Uncharacterized protein n=1 Tax=Vibrio panuliri TaxID=1381081 RepID=A0A1Q9HF79_9VIBR|nr:hypothetical protein [Vibrio panuliri]KAB1454387.1 hypothetical protein F7O85_16025 [Vibrio panuliri]OLQ87792.1 hypothetical protein BIY20_02105 [Vibrio panuliri]OLQ88393.1 hypothetical protein BIY22_09540 [Vibrio panuliri]